MRNGIDWSMQWSTEVCRSPTISRAWNSSRPTERASGCRIVWTTDLLPHEPGPDGRRHHGRGRQRQWLAPSAHNQIVETLVAIGDFSKMTYFSVKALRHYHDVGLLEPADVDPSTGYRRYATSQVPVALAIRRFRDLDMPLEEIRLVLAAPDPATGNRTFSVTSNGCSASSSSRSARWLVVARGPEWPDRCSGPRRDQTFRRRPRAVGIGAGALRRLFDLVAGGARASPS